MTIDDTLQERGSRYGEFENHAQISQDLKAVMRSTPNWEALPAHTKEGLEMIQHKIARALNGDPSYADNFHDVAGYSQLVEQILERPKPEQQPTEKGE